MHYKKKLIEVALPLEAINAESAREKSIRHGHPSTLHLWWARRPLAAARAVIWSSLVDDPSSLPEQFPTEEAQNAERQRLFGILERLVKWENSNNEEVLAEAKAEIMKSTGGNPPALLDPFAGGGSIPLEAQRLGLEAHASDLNPVAVMINKAMIEIPPKFAGQPPVNPDSRKISGTWTGTQGLAEDVRYYGEWMKREAFKRIGHLYPKVKDAQCAGIRAKYVLFDSWFSAPKTIIALKKQEHLDTIAMLKKSKTKYAYSGERLNVKEIYSRNRKRRGRSRYLLSVSVDIFKDGETVPAKLVYVRNRSKRKDWLVLVSTDTQLSEEEIIRIYGKRWDIEVFFKACKSYLSLVKEYRGISYDAMNAHVAIVFARYMMLSVAQRENEDDRTICELCFCLMDEMEDITFSRSMCIIMDALMEAVMEYFHITEAQLEEFTCSFIQRLPKYMQDALNRREIAA